MRTKLLKDVVLLGMSVVLAMGMMGCIHKGKDDGGIDQKSFEVGGVSFKMNKITEVTSGISTIGDDIEGDNDKRPIQISAYMIGETEVTQELWQAVMGNNPSHFKDSPADGEVQAKRPVECVSWYDAIAFCNKLSIKLGKDPCYTVNGVTDWENLAYNAIPTSDDADWNNTTLDLTKNGFRLPTETEWEWAAKGGTEDKWAGTNTESELVNYAWYDGNSDRKTHEAKKKKSNGYGLYDMSGNVLEWNWDWFANITGGADLGKDYEGAPSGSERVLRGGCSSFDESGCSRSHRGNLTPDYQSHILGFRLVCCP